MLRDVEKKRARENEHTGIGVLAVIMLVVYVVGYQVLSSLGHNYIGRNYVGNQSSAICGHSYAGHNYLGYS